MRVVGIVCEYNPFHAGHAFQLARARQEVGADYVICAMSGAFTQRGLPARHDKWLRARMALENGADLVLELPTRFACSGARDFASGGVSLLAATGVVTHLSFGCEPEALSVLSPLSSALRQEPESFRLALRAALSRGLSYPAAMAEAAQTICDLPNIAAALALPNATLALEYLRALPESIQPVPVARKGSGYHAGTLSPDALPSATAIRQALCEGRLADALAATPCAALLAGAENSGCVHDEEALAQLLLYRLRTMPPEEIALLPGMGEGLHHRFASAARTACTRAELIAAVKSKRYTHARLSRSCAAALLSMTQPFMDAHPAPTTLRVLGFRKDAAPLLSAVRRQSSLPLVTKTADADRADPLFALDILAQDLWSLGCQNVQLRKAGRDFTTSPVIVT